MAKPLISEIPVRAHWNGRKRYYSVSVWRPPRKKWYVVASAEHLVMVDVAFRVTAGVHLNLLPYIRGYLGRSQQFMHLFRSDLPRAVYDPDRGPRFINPATGEAVSTAEIAIMDITAAKPRIRTVNAQ